MEASSPWAVRGVRKTAYFAVASGLLIVSLMLMSEFFTCRSKLRNVFLNNLMEYRIYHGGHNPPNIVSVAAAFPGFIEETNADVLLGRLSCPSSRTRLSLTSTTKSLRSDFIYMNWEPYFGTNAVPEDYPLFYDGRLANHFGMGVNVLTTSRLFWDFRAHWLRDFAAKHPEYHVPIPE
jgi:hypothetical protein